MSKTISIQHQSLIDLAIEKQGTMEAVFDLALKNNAAIVGALPVGSVVNYTAAVDEEVAHYFSERTQSIATLEDYETATITGVFPAIFNKVDEQRSNTIISQQNQNLLDVALAHYGTIEAMFDLALKNNQGVSAAPAPGFNYTMPKAIEEKKAKAYLFKNNMRFATHGDYKIASPYFETGYFEPEYFNTN